MMKQMIMEDNTRHLSKLQGVLALTLIVLLAAALRFYKLGYWSLWIDEAFTINDALHNPLGTKPLNYLFVRFFLLHFGISEWTARLGPAVVGILSIVCAYFFFKRVFDQNTRPVGIPLSCSVFMAYLLEPNLSSLLLAPFLRYPLHVVFLRRF